MFQETPTPSIPETRSTSIRAFGMDIAGPVGTPNAQDHEYASHCHIIDPEDNEMMRPSIVQPNPVASRSFHLGTDY